MKKKNLLTAFLLTATMLAAVTGCSSNDSKTNDTTDAGTTSSTTEAAEKSGAGDSDGVINKTGLPIVNSEYSFSVFADENQTADDLYMLGVLEEQTGISVDWQFFPYETAKEQLGLALNSGTYADAIGGWILTDSDILTYGVDMGIFIPLEDYFEEYAPNIMAMLELEGVRDAMTAPDGHIYSIPYVSETPAVDFNPYVNTEWLANVGMEMPTTTDELVEVLRAFRDQDANGNGDPSDEIPLTCDPNNLNKLTYLCGYFGSSVGGSKGNYGFTMEGDELVFGANSDAYKEGIKFLNSLYAEGLIDPEIFTQDKATYTAKGGENLYGVCIMYGSGDIMPYDAGTKPNWEPVPVLSSEYCDTPVWLRNSYGNYTFRTQLVVTDAAENPEAIVRYWDNVFELENSLQVVNGPVDILIFPNEEGGYDRIDSLTLSEEDQHKYAWSNLWPQSLPKYIPAGYRLKEANPPYEEKPPVDALYEEYMTEYTIPTYWIATEDSAEFSELQTSIEDYLVQKRAEWISGVSDIEADWDSYLSQLEKLNLPRYIEMRQEALSN